MMSKRKIYGGVLLSLNTKSQYMSDVIGKMVLRLKDMEIKANGKYLMYSEDVRSDNVMH